MLYKICKRVENIFCFTIKLLLELFKIVRQMFLHAWHLSGVHTETPDLQGLCAPHNGCALHNSDWILHSEHEAIN